MKIDAVTLPNGKMLVAIHSFESMSRAEEIGARGEDFSKSLDLPGEPSMTAVFVSAQEPIEFGTTFPEVTR